jgi:hypothetical protein
MYLTLLYVLAVCQVISHLKRGMPSNRRKQEINMNSALALLAMVLALATSVAAVRAETVVRYATKSGVPHVVHVPDRPSATSRQKTITYGSALVERRNGRWVVRPNR